MSDTPSYLDYNQQVHEYVADAQIDAAYPNGWRWQEARFKLGCAAVWALLAIAQAIRERSRGN